MTESRSLTVPLVCIVGPTASGKSALAQRIAKAIDGEIISADSMQIYRGMDIGTGKVPPSEREVPHHGLDLCEPGEAYSAALYQEYARSAIDDISARGRRPIICGGTGFYVRAAVDDYVFPPGTQVENPIRRQYQKLAEEQGAQAVWDELKKLDPGSAFCIHPNNVKRVIRALEMHFEGTSYEKQLEKLHHIPQVYPAVFIGLQIEPSELRERINHRVDEMMEEGLLDEVKHLLEKGFRAGITAPQAIGYKELVAYIDGECTLSESVEAIKAATRKYAKRQRSWFNSDNRIQWIPISKDLSDDPLISALKIIELYEETHSCDINGALNA